MQRIVEAYRMHAEETGTQSEVIPSVITVEIANRSGGAEVDEDAVANLARRVLAAEGIEDGDLGLVFVAPAEMRALKRATTSGRTR